MSKEVDATATGTQQRKKIKVVVAAKRKRNKERGVVNTRRVGLPEIQRKKPRQEDDGKHSSSRQEDDNFFSNDEDFNDDDIACDTMLLIHSLQRNRQCFFIPLLASGGREVPAVLQSQLYQKLESHEGYDSTVTQELQNLLRKNRIRQLTPVQDDTVVAYLETSHYARAVWDAHRSNNNNPKVTAWFLAQLPHWTKRVITRKDMEEAWTEKIPSATAAIDQLIMSNIIIKKTSTSSFLLWLPQWGLVLSSLDKAQLKIINQLKRSHFKELSEATFQSQSFGGLTGSFVIHTLVASGKVTIKERPAGKFLKLT